MLERLDDPAHPRQRLPDPPQAPLDRLVVRGLARQQLQLKLDQNLMVGDTIVAARGSLGKATITRVEHAGRGGKPGVIGFKVETLVVNGVSIPLSANLTLAAPDIAAQAAKISNPSVVRISGTLPKGDEAVIEPGMPLTAIVEEDTELH